MSTRRDRYEHRSATVALAGLVAAAVACVSAVVASAFSAGSLEVCASGCTYSQIAPAVAAAKSGDTIKVAAGTYQGGFTIGVSMKLVGAGAHATIIRGGGPVVTIGRISASRKFTVAISGVTITGGVTHSSPGLGFGGKAGVNAFGGGVQINPHIGAPDTPQVPDATVTISNSVITGNRVAPIASVPGPANFACPSGPCPFNAGLGGGIFNGGALTVRDSMVTDNQASGVNGQGGGIYSEASLTLINTTVSHNQALAPTAMVGRFAEGGGIFVLMGSTLTVMHSLVTANSSILTSTLPVKAGGQTINMVANGGGIHVDDGSPVTVENTTITGNSVSAVDPGGPANAINAAMQVGDGHLIMRNTVISHNHVSSIYATDGVTLPSATSLDTGGQGGTIEVDGGGTIQHTKITDNTSTSTSTDGPVDENSGLDVFPPSTSPAHLLTVQDSVIRGNTATASSGSGSATVEGAGILNTSLLKLANDQVRDNTGHATGKTGLAEGAGIWNGSSGPGTTVSLTLDHTVVTHNSLTASPGVTVQGAGLFTTISPVTLTASTITANTPDDCSGVAC